VDTFSREFRSALMSRIKGHSNLSTELRLIEIFRVAKVKGWRRRSNLLGRPDFIFPREKIAIFADGCFWHGCPSCQKFSKSNTDYWRPKIQRNQQRDRQVTRKLRHQGWSVLRVWECQLKRPNKFLGRLRSKLLSRKMTL